MPEQHLVGAENRTSQLKIALSFDHELSLGGARCYARNLFKPADELLDLADRLHVPLTLFTDIWAAIRFREWDDSGFFEPYRRQLTRALQSDHDVQLHIHPHWVDSAYREGRFIPSKNYRLADFRDCPPPQDIPGIVARGFEVLTDLCRSVRTDYQCVAYRGGGYNLQPETQAILGSLYRLGVRIDSTIVKGMLFHSQVNTTDYRYLPDQANWFISPEGPLEQPARDGIFEVPIASMPRNVLNNLPILVKRLLKRRQIYDSTGQTLEAQTSSIWDRISRLWPRSAWIVSFDGYAQSVSDILRILNYHWKKHSSDPVVICAACSHPKFMGPYQRSVMAEFVCRVREQLGERVEFVTFRQIYDELGLND